MATDFYEQVEQSGPGLPRKPLDEMDEQELRDVMTYLRNAYEAAVKSEAPREVLDYIVEEHDAVVFELVQESRQFANWVRGAGYIPLGPLSERKELRAKYRQIVIDALS